MNIPEVVRRYAVTLLDAAQETGVEEEIKRDLQGIEATLDSSQELHVFLQNRLLGFKAKQEALEKLFADHVATLTMNFIRLLAQRGRAAMFSQITQACLQIIDERSGAATAHVRSAIALDEAQADRLRRRLAGYFGGDIRLDVNVDDTMRGGLIATVGDTVFDGSVEAHLRRLHRKLLGDSTS